MEILSTVDGLCTVKSGTTVYQIQEASLETIKVQVEQGADAGVLLSLIAGANAKTAKVFDAEKAQREAEKALKVQALADFEKELEGWVWSDNVLEQAQSVVRLRLEQAQIEETPFSITLEGYSRNSPSTRCEPGEYRFTYYKGVPSLVVGLKGPLPRQMVLGQEIDVALNAFRTTAADEVTVPSVLKTENTKKDFDVDDDGNIVYNVKVGSGRGGGGNGGKKVSVMHVASGTVYESQSDAAKAYPDLVGNVLHPHAKVASLAKKGEIFRFA